ACARPTLSLRTVNAKRPNPYPAPGPGATFAPPRNLGGWPIVESARTVLILYLLCTACTTWRPDTLTPQAVVQGHPRSLRVTRRDSSQVVLTTPQLQGDTILGLGPKKAQVRVPLDSVLLTDTRHGDGGMTVLVVVGVLATLFAVATAVLPHSY